MAVNDAPTGSASASLADGTENTNYIISAASLLQGFGDVDGDTLSISGLNADHGTVANNSDGTFTISHSLNYNGPVALSYSVIDGHGGSVAGSQSYNLAVSVNHAPILIAPLVNQAVQYDASSLSYNASTSFSDTDISDPLNYSATLANGNPIPGWMHIDATTGLMTGTPGFNDRGTFALSITATDTHGSGVSAPLTVAVTAFDAGRLLVSTNGNDTLAGTLSNDTVTYGYAVAPVIASLAIITQQNTGGAGLDTLTNIDNLIGSDFNDTLTGNTQKNVLDGGIGADALRGGAGDDIYIVDNTGDVITEGSGAGTDAVNSSVTYALAANVENLALIGALAINGTGNSLPNSISGNAANNTLNGGTGADTLVGGLGDDNYVVDNAGDVVTEGSGAGTDIVNSSVAYTLPINVENLTLTGTSAINGTGNDLANILIGNSAANLLDGGAGTDALKGGAGDDTYIIDNAGDVITEGSGAGTDTVNSSVTYTLLGNIENLTLTGASAINGTGNGLANIITGNAADNALNGGAGADTLVGGLGNDIYTVDNAGDIVTEGLTAGTDKVNSSITYTLLGNVENLTLTGTSAINGTGNDLANTLIGNSAANQLNGGNGNDILDGGTGINTLTGGAGNDIFRLTTAGHTDTITDYNVVNDTIQIENAVFTALKTTGTLAASQFVTGTNALDANDFIIYTPATGVLLYDADGNGAAAAVQIATVGINLTMTNADIVVI